HGVLAAGLSPAAWTCPVSGQRDRSRAGVLLHHGPGPYASGVAAATARKDNMGPLTAGRVLGLLLFLPWAIACDPPPELVSEHAPPRHKCTELSSWPSWAMCIPPPGGRLLEGRPTSQWSPACDVELDELVAPCGRG